MKDKQIEFLEAQIEMLEKVKAERLKKLADPNYTAVKKLYQEIQTALVKLRELGDYPTDHEGQELIIDGNLFRITGTEIEEKS